MYWFAILFAIHQPINFLKIKYTSMRSNFVCYFDCTVDWIWGWCRIPHHRLNETIVVEHQIIIDRTVIPYFITSEIISDNYPPHVIQTCMETGDHKMAAWSMDSKHEQSVCAEKNIFFNVWENSTKITFPWAYYTTMLT